MTSLRAASRRCHALYRLYDVAGALLWIGSTQHPATRVRAHATKPWGSQIDPGRTTIEWLEPGADAGAVELAAIRTELPRHNIAGVTRPYSRPVAVRAILEEPDLTVQDVAKLLNVRPETVRRYLTNGAFPGAYRTTDSPKAVWRIPRAAIIAWRNRGRSAALSRGVPGGTSPDHYQRRASHT